MATGEIAHAAARAGADGAGAGMRLGRDASPIVRSHVEQLGLEGKIFIAGVGLEGTALTGRTSLADTTPDIWLQSPSGGNVLIRPLHFEALVTAEGDAAPDWYLPRNPYLIVGLAPLVLLTVLGLGLLPVLPRSVLPPAWFALTFNAAGAVGDMVVVGWLLTKPRSVLVNDEGDKFSVFGTTS